MGNLWTLASLYTALGAWDSLAHKCAGEKHWPDDQRLSRELRSGADLDGQQWIWVAAVLVSAATLAFLMAFGRR